MAQSAPVPHTITIVFKDGNSRREIQHECISRGACERVRREARTFHGADFVCAIIEKTK